jgi:Holliday junction resolvase RusA-like endonuclease
MIQLRATHRAKSLPKLELDNRQERKSPKSISLELDIPPSVNHLYIKRRGGGVALSESANKYREHVKKVLATKMVELSLFPAEDQNIVYSIDVTFYMNKLELPGWFEFYEKDSFYAKDSKDGKAKKGDLKNKKGERKSKSRYKKVDVDNRVKFVQDCVIRGLGIPDDCQVFEGAQRKIQTNGLEKVRITVSVADRQKFFQEE